MAIRVPDRYVTLAILGVVLVGLVGWGAPFVLAPTAGGSGYTTEHIYVRADDRITTAALYLPDGDEPVPGVVFGAGSGTAPALYTNYGAALATNGLAVLVAGQTRELEAGKPIRWETRRERSSVFEYASDNYANWVSYLASHPRVDEDRLVLAGHSGGANSAYRVAYDRPDVDGASGFGIGGIFEDARVMALNRLLVVGLWAAGIGVAYHWSRSRGVFQQLFTWEHDATVLAASLAAVALHLLNNVVMSVLETGSLAPQMLGEYALYVSTYGPPEGTAVYALQLLYYLVESLIVVGMIALYQRAGERDFDANYVPWGGIGLALTWGALHALMSGSLEVLVLPLAMGVVYLVGKKHAVPVFLAVALVFVI